jgi:hypothetical protein
MLKLVIKIKRVKLLESMKFSDLHRGDFFCFLNGEYTYKKVGNTVAMPMCSPSKALNSMALRKALSYVK